MCVCIFFFFFFYMGLNHYIGSFLNYRPLSPSLSCSVIMLFRRLCCVQECGFLLFFNGRRAHGLLYASRIWIFGLRIRFGFSLPFSFPLGDEKTRERNVTALVFSAVFIVSPLSHFESFPYQQRNSRSPLV